MNFKKTGISLLISIMTLTAASPLISGKVLADAMNENNVSYSPSNIKNIQVLNEIQRNSTIKHDGNVTTATINDDKLMPILDKALERYIYVSLLAK